eukprot:TRINITY_DN6365_c0_g1_i1.p1 TRINITY_DN6365_c0_g1~~TRINITY_DN6365_c0_g1_i1.p1  ORF type:complete len:317 (-),score=49.11 TRINITY_DN6365_c0_g1_i1:30-980(-)
MEIAAFLPAECKQYASKALDQMDMDDGLARVQFVTPGEVITSDTSFLRGHGTYVGPSGQLIASVAGVVERVNKLITVKPLKSRYVGEVGDVIIGRVVETLQKKWRLDIGARQDGILQLSAINLPGGVQRRRNATDELNMRMFFVEGDLISCEVQQLYQDGAMALHTRSLKYGKLENGQLVSVAPSLVKRSKTHFQQLPCGVHVLLGINGFIWVSPPPPDVSMLQQQEKELAADAALVFPPQPPPNASLRQAIARVSNAIMALDRLFLAISADTIMDVYNSSVQSGIAVADMLRPDTLYEITTNARARKSSAAIHMQ